MPIDSSDNPFAATPFSLPPNDITDNSRAPWQAPIINGARGPISGSALSGFGRSAGMAAASKVVVTELAGHNAPPPNSLPFSIYQRVLVTLQPIADSEQVLSQTNIEIANRVPLELPVVDVLTNNNWTTVTNGMGEAAGLDLGPGNAAILDKFGVTVFDELADFEILWSIGVGLSATTTIAPIKVLLPQTRGWRYGPANEPVPLTGNRVVFSKQDTIRISVMAQHSATTAGVIGSWKPTCHYVEVALTGWLIPGWHILPGSQSYTGQDL